MKPATNLLTGFCKLWGEPILFYTSDSTCTSRFLVADMITIRSASVIASFVASYVDSCSSDMTVDLAILARIDTRSLASKFDKGLIKNTSLHHGQW